MSERLVDEGKREALKKDEDLRASLIRKGQTDYPCNQSKTSEGVLLNAARPLCSKGYCCGGANNGKPTDDKDYVGVETCQQTTVVNVEYYPPRPSKLSTVAPAMVTLKFACIEGAQ